MMNTVESNKNCSDSAFFQQTKKIKSPFQRTGIGISIIFFVLGVGNIFFGAQKYEEYLEAIRQSNAPETEIHRELRLHGIELPERSSERQSLEKIRGRLEFYRVVKAGGTLFLLIGVAILIVTLSGRRAGRE